jgi:hypothetical protein
MPVIVKLRADTRGHMDVSNTADGRWRIRICVTLLALATLAPIRFLSAIEPRTAEDEAAEREFGLAAPELDHMNRVLSAEMQRLLGGGRGSQSPEVAKYLDGPSVKRVELGDVRISLHVRFIERQRRNFVDGIALAKTATAGNCANPSPGPDQLLDAELRAKVLTALKCHQQALDRYQSGMHKINQGYEAMLLELKLPPFTRERMLAQAHASTVRQDAELSSDYTNQRKTLQANIDFFTYLDAHAAHAHYVNNRILFDDPEEAKTMQDLLNRLGAVSQ